MRGAWSFLATIKYQIKVKPLSIPTSSIPTTTESVGRSVVAHHPAVNECEVVELEGGSLMLNMRNYDRKLKTRQTAISTDGGQNWSNQRHDETLVEPICQASLRRFRWKSDEKPGVILFSNPANTTERKSMTVRASYDDGETWKHTRLIYEGGSAYSCLAILPDGSIGCLYEKDGYKNIVLARFPLSWIVEQ